MTQDNPAGMPEHNRQRDAAGNPDVLWISEEAIALTLEDCYEGEGISYTRTDIVQQDIKKLREALKEALSVLALVEDEPGVLTKSGIKRKVLWDQALADTAHWEGKP